MSQRGWALAPWLALVACGGGGSGPDAGANSPDAGGVNLSAFCASALAGFERAVHPDNACGSPLTLADFPHLLDPYDAGSYAALYAAMDCNTGVFGGFQLQLERSIQMGLMRFDPARAAACAALGQGQDGGLLLSDLDAGLVDFCSDALVGLVALDGGCTVSEECAGDAYCLPSPTSAYTCGGRCVGRLSAGQTCDPAVDVCTAGASCFDPGDGGHPACLAAHGLGEACPGTEPCAPLLDCVAPADGGFATCAARGAAGASCGAPGQGLPTCGPCLACVQGLCTAVVGVGGVCRTSQECVNGTYCTSGDGGTCATSPRNGEPCVAAPGPHGELGNCMYTADTFCQRQSADASVGFCVPQPGPGQSCGDGPDLWPSCSGGWWCGIADAGRGSCQLAPGGFLPCLATAAGWACQPGLLCQPALDGGMLCLPGPAAFEPCAAGNVCGSGAYCGAADGGLFCLPQKGAGQACATAAECGLGSNCDAWTGTCVAPCTQDYAPAGCRNGARQMAVFLLFGGLVWVRRAGLVLTRRR